MATAKIADNGIDLAGIAQLANLFLGKTTTAQNSGGTSTTGSKTTSENVDPAAVAATVKSILEGTQGLASVSMGQKKAGLYNSSTNQLLSNDLIARTAAEASKLNKTTTTSVNEGTVDNKSTTTTTQPPISTGTAVKGASLLTGLSLLPADVRKNLLAKIGVGANSPAAAGNSAQEIFRQKEIDAQNSGGDSTAAIISTPVASSPAVSSGTDAGTAATSNDAAVSNLGGDDYVDPSLISGDAGNNIGSLDDVVASNAGMDVISDVGADTATDATDFTDYGEYFARGGAVSNQIKGPIKTTNYHAGYAEGGPVNTGLRNTPLNLQTESDPTDVTQVVGSLTGRIGQSGERTTGGTKAVNNSNTGNIKSKGGSGSIDDLQPGSTTGDDTGTNSGSVGNAASNAAVVNGLAPMLASLITANPLIGLAVKAGQTIAGIPTQSVNPISQIVTALANANAGNDTSPDPDPEGSVSVGAIGQADDPDGNGQGSSTGAPDVGTAAGGTSAGNAPGDSAPGDTGSSSDGNGPGSDSSSSGADSSGDALTKGGNISGPGSSTSDSIPISVSDGEFVMNAEAVKAFGPIIEHMNNLGRKMMDKKSGYARGGAVKMGR